MVTAEVDIAADGSITVTPNPIGVASGDTLFFHVNTNRSDFQKFTVTFPGGPRSPFGSRTTAVTVTARRCNAGGIAVSWPPGVNSATVTLSVHNSPAARKLRVRIIRISRRGASIRRAG
jgi:hypothetical protein